MSWFEPILDRDLVPDRLLRAAIRRLIAGRLRQESRRANLDAYAAMLANSPIAIHTGSANQQHYEVPTEFFQLVLGPHLKYSSCLWAPGDTLETAERRMLELTVERARIWDGHSILDLGCGWGSFALFAAARFPNSPVLAVSNSNSQRVYIEGEARARGLSNLQVVTADIRDFQPGRRFDRIVSVEMLEHVRNYKALFERIATWMEPDAQMFVHIFSHSRFAYTFETEGPSDWMAEHFFTGGQMPADGLFEYFQDDLRIADHWTHPGTHYQRTLETWLERLDAQRPAVNELFERVYGRKEALKWLVRWRIFFMASAELWGYRQGREWIVSHYLFTRR